jgi:predicted DNA-binding protein
MTKYGTIKLPREAYERHNDRRQDLGLTWAEYVDGEAPSLPDTEELVDAIAAEADGQGRVDDSELAREVARQLDYGELANAVADELEARRR